MIVAPTAKRPNADQWAFGNQESLNDNSRMKYDHAPLKFPDRIIDVYWKTVSTTSESDIDDV